MSTEFSLGLTNSSTIETSIQATCGTTALPKYTVTLKQNVAIIPGTATVQFGGRWFWRATQPEPPP